MNEHYIVAVDGGQIHIYTEANSAGSFLRRLQRVEPDFATERDHYADRELPAHGTFPVTDRRRSGRQLALHLNAFLRGHPKASWDFVASAAVYRSVADALAPDVLRRLKRVYPSEFLSRHMSESGMDLAAV